jgi:hypothetical protein
MAGFKECIIIPLEVFKKCDFSERSTNPSILTPRGPTTSVIPMLHKQTEKPIVYSRPVNDIDSIVAELPVEKQTQAKRILHKLSPMVMSWNERLEITVYGKHFPHSNIIDILRYLLKVPGADRPPIAEAAFREAIQNTGDIPMSGIKKTKIQKGTGTKRKIIDNWISY